MHAPPPATPARGASLRVRWTASLLVASLVPLGLLAGVTARTVRAGLVEAERDLQLSVIDFAARTLTREVEFAEESTHRVGRTLLDAGPADADGRVALARDTAARAAALLHVAVYSPAGERVDTIYRRAAGAREPAPLERVPPALLRSPPRAGQWLPAEFTPAGPAIRYAEAVADGAVVRAWVVATLDPRWLAATVEQLSARQYDARHRLLLVDAGLRRLVPGDEPAGASLARRDVFQGAGFLRAQRDREQADVALFMEYDDRGEPMAGAFRAMRRMQWFVAVRRPQREAYRALAAARRNAAWGALACAGLAVALGAWLARRTARPIEALAALTGDYAARRFGARSTVRTGDELERLGGALEAMADGLAATEAEVARRARVEADLARYLPAEVARAVADGTQALALGGARRDVAVLFADVAGFTAFAEGAAPERVAALLNELFGVLTEVVFRHGGMVDKFMGDCVMAVFGTGSDPRDGAAGPPDAPAARALAAAEDMHRFVEASAPAWKGSYGAEVRLAIGVNRGEALVGNLGTEGRMEYTAIGDVVNVAARLEGLARAGQTLATAAVRDAAGAGFGYVALGERALRGKLAAVEIFEVTT